jgi:hypothetical protein
MNIINYYQKGIYKPPYKIIVIGDVHGDYNAFVHCLKKSKLVNKDLNWIGGKTQVVQMGDILDRMPRTENYTDEDSEFTILNLIYKLQMQSFEVGGGFHCIIGNHELMNVMGMMDYVSKEGINHFGGKANRIKALKPGSSISCYLGSFWNPIIKIGNYVFCHGGISDTSSQYKIEDINLLMRSYLNGKTDLINSQHFKRLFLNDNSLCWYRKYSSKNKYKDIELNNLKIFLKRFNAKSLVVGHTPQDNINSIDNGLIWRVDCGMSDAFGEKNNDYSKVQVLQIINNGRKINIL